MEITKEQEREYVKGAVNILLKDVKDTRDLGMNQVVYHKKYYE